VQHAHQKAIIHRDLKPSNVLVTEHDGRPVPKIIDFGVAKATTPITDHTSLTELGQVIGTREYMSPEQAEGRVLEVDTRSDIYALGTLLYSLLTGTTPFASEQLAGPDYVTLQRLLRETDPATPSKRFEAGAKVTEGESTQAKTVAARRGTDPPTLRRRLRGDLDWIVMKALEKDRDRRYQSADALTRDIERHLRHEPVVAGPPSAAYRARKFLTRNRGAVISAAAVALSLIAGIVLATIFALGQARARSEAETAQQEAEAVLEFLNDDLLAAAAPGEQGRDASLRDAMDAAAEKIGDRFEDRPQVEASIRMTLANTYRELGLYEGAQPHLEIALQLLEDEVPSDRERMGEALHHLGSLYRDQGLYDQAVEALERGAELTGDLHGVESPEMATMLATLGDVHSRQGQYEAAESNLEAALEIQRTVFGEENEHTSRTMGNLAVLYRRLGRFEKAESLQLRVIEIGEKMHGREHPTVTIRLNNLAVLYTSQGRYQESERLLRHILASDLKKYGDEHPDVATDLFNLADVLTRQARYDEAIDTYRRVLAIDEKASGPDHPKVGGDLVNLAAPLAQAGLEGEAELHLRRGLAILESSLGDSHPEVGNALLGLGELLRRQGRFEEAGTLLARGAAILETTENRVLAARANRALGLLHLDQGHNARAEALLRKALTVSRRELSPTHPYRVQAEEEYRALSDSDRSRGPA
jgi:tetratricopeptide (TPR) repeat protein